MKIEADIKGEAALDYALGIAGPRIADRVMQQAVKDVATDTAKDAAADAPVDSGTLRRAIKAKSERAKPGLFVASVYVTKGRQAKDDAWYWNFVEFGTVRASAKPFITPAYDRMRQRLIGGELNELLAARIVKQMAATRKRVSK